MTTKEVAAAIVAMDPVDLKDLFAELHKGFFAKAEKIYDANPEENGLLAQSYSDLSSACQDATTSFDEVDNGLPFEEVVDAPGPTTVSAFVSGNPWRGR
jgi:hypothetical protein